MLKLKFLVSVIAMSFIVGCGGGSSSTSAVVVDGINTVDNSVLTDGSTSLGYYGEAVMFGNHTVARVPTPIHSDTQPFFIRTVCQ